MKTKEILAYLTIVLIIFGCQSPKEKRYFHRGGRGGAITKYYFLDKQVIKKHQIGQADATIYNAEIETDDKDSGVSKEMVLVQCSTSEPFVAIKAFQENNKIDIRYLNPGGYIYGYMEATHGIYWIVCHDVSLIDDYSLLEKKARDLGYPLNLEERIIEVPGSDLKQLVK